MTLEFYILVPNNPMVYLDPGDILLHPTRFTELGVELKLTEYEGSELEIQFRYLLYILQPWQWWAELQLERNMGNEMLNVGEYFIERSTEVHEISQCPEKVNSHNTLLRLVNSISKVRSCKGARLFLPAPQAALRATLRILTNKAACISRSCVDRSRALRIFANQAARIVIHEVPLTALVSRSLTRGPSPDRWWRCPRCSSPPGCCSPP